MSRWLAVVAIAVVATVAGVWIPVASAAPFAYTGDGDTTGGNLYRIDLANNSITTVGPMPGVLLEALSFGPGGLTLYGVDDGANALYSINTTTGAPTLIGALGVTVSDPGMAFCPDNSTMYLITEDGTLYRINLGTGAATSIGTGSVQGISSLSCTVGGTLYGVSDVTDSLYTLNRTTGAATLVGPLGIDVSNSGLGADGARLLLVHDTTPSNLYEVNTTTGAATVVVQLSAGALNLESMAVDEEAAGGPVAESSVSVPTLGQWSTIALTILVALAFVVMNRRRST